MIRNYFVIALRNLLRNKTFSFINIMGMAIGLSCCFVIALFIQNELEYDRFHSKHQRIFRVASDLKSNNSINTIAATPAPWGPLLQNEFPQIESSVRLLKDNRALVGIQGEQRFYEENVFFSDSSIFSVFDFPLISGNASKALTDPNTAVLTTSIAKKYFGDADPIGKTIQVTTAFGQEFSLLITGVTNDVPAQSHFHFNMLLSMSSLGDISWMWSYHMFQTYVLLKDQNASASLEKMFPAFAEKYINKNAQADGEVRLFLQPVTDIHLHSRLTGEVETNGNIVYVYVLSGIAAFILALACFNFMNLATANALLRAKEVGMRKAVGAKRTQLVAQFMGEAVLLTFSAAFIGLIITQAILPFFNTIAQRELSFVSLLDLNTILMVVGFLLLIAAGTGIYPSAVLSSFKPVDVLKSKFQRGVRGNAIRKTLVVFQFAISIVLIACTLILYSQLDFLKNKDLGFDQSQVMILTIPRGATGEKITEFENMLRSQSSVIAASASSSVPSEFIPVNQIRYEGSVNNENTSMEMIFADHDFIKTMGMEIVGGRDFSIQSPSDAQAAFIINEKAAKEFGWNSPQEAINKKFEWVLPDRVLKSGTIIGVIKDSNFRSLNFKIQPLVIHIQPNRFQYLYVKFQPGAADNNIKMLESQYKSAFPLQPFEFTFLDETVQHLYENEQRLGQIFSYASGLAIIIASLGIFALSMHSARQRIKEVGTRKVLGAGITDILKLSSREFLTLVLLANIFAWPLAWYAANQWLKVYAYKVEVSWWVFALSGVLVLFIAIFTVSFEAIKAAMSNPADSLRNE